MGSSGDMTLLSAYWIDAVEVGAGWTYYLTKFFTSGWYTTGKHFSQAGLNQRCWKPSLDTVAMANGSKLLTPSVSSAS
jgi:hypothetical protein